MTFMPSPMESRRHVLNMNFSAVFSHWTDADVTREKELMEIDDIVPTHVLRSNFSEVLGLFDFVGAR